MSFGKWVRDNRLAAGLTQEELGAKWGAKLDPVTKRSKGYVSQIEADKNPQTGKPIPQSIENIRALVRVFQDHGLPVTDQDAFKSSGIDLSQADKTTSYEDLTRDPLFKSLLRFGRILADDLPHLGTVPAGVAERRYQELRGSLASTLGADYIVEVQGDSMSPHYKDGDILLVRRNFQPQPGDVVIALVYGDSVCKMFSEWRFDGDTNETIYTLSPTNHKYREIRASDVEFQGVVIAKVEPTHRLSMELKRVLGQKREED